MKKKYLTPRMVSVEMKLEDVLAASYVLGGEGKDDVEFDVHKKVPNWDAGDSEDYWK